MIPVTFRLPENDDRKTLVLSLLRRYEKEAIAIVENYC